MYKQDLESDLCDPEDYKNKPEYPMLLNEIRIACTMAMLLCLDHKHRVAYILGEILEIDAGDASEILSVSSDNFRQLLSRARKKVAAFTENTCGLVAECANCTCEKKLTGSINRGRVSEKNIVFADKYSKSYQQVLKTIQDINKLKSELRTKAAQSSVPDFKSPKDFSQLVHELAE